MSAVTQTTSLVLDKHFIDWESHTFGFGYGTGEPHTIQALKEFMGCLDGKRYDYRVLESRLTPTVAWLLINTLCHADILEYGTSPRYGWATPKGEALRNYLEAHTATSLVELVTSVDEYYVHCFPDLCQCEEACNNPLFG